MISIIEDCSTLLMKYVHRVFKPESVTTGFFCNSRIYLQGKMHEVKTCIHSVHHFTLLYTTIFTKTNLNKNYIHGQVRHDGKYDNMQKSIERGDHG